MSFYPILWGESNSSMKDLDTSYKGRTSLFHPVIVHCTTCILLAALADMNALFECGMGCSHMRNVPVS